MLKTLALAFLLLICEVLVDAQTNSILTIKLTEFRIDNGLYRFSDVFGCNQTMQTISTVTVSSDFDIQAQSGITYGPDLLDNAFSLAPTFNFTLNGHQMTTLIIGIQFNFTCWGVFNPDNAVLLIQNLNSTEMPTILVAPTNVNHFNVSASYTKQCSSSNQYGFNCDTHCQSVMDNVECYVCAIDGSKSCCNNNTIDPHTCRYFNSEPTVTTVNPSGKSGGGSGNSNSKETLYMWIMIGLAIVLFILIVIIVIALFVWCCRQPSKVIVAPAPSPVTPQYMPPPPEQARPLPPYEYSNYRKPATPQQSRRNTHIAKPAEVREWDDESLASDWVEPQPRRIAQNAAAVSRSSSVRIIEEPLDIVV